MKKSFRRIRFILWIAAVSIGLLYGGCAVMPHSYTAGEPISEKTVERIQPGKTTKGEIIQWFGLPQSIEKPIVEKEAAVEREEKVATGGAWLVGGGTTFQPSFELFSSKHKITKDHRIYVYTFTKTKGGTFVILFFGSTDSHSLSDKLLILVNEKTEIVEDYIFRKETK